MKPKEDIGRLPQWAQDKIIQLRRHVADLQATLAGDRAGRPESPIQIVDSVHETSRGVNESFEKVRIAIGTERRPDGRPLFYVDIDRTEDGRLQIMGTDSLLFYSHSSNMFFVDMVDRVEHSDQKRQRDLGQRLLEEALGKGLDWQDAMNLVNDCDPATVKATRNRYRPVVFRPKD